ncbi:MAG: ROK family glucokinase [Oscillospiraceae bacterium]|nr:ROK family glucokinase [Oscillospiraceae bacterium]
MEQYYIGIDLGGTTVKAAVLNEAGDILSNVHLDCPRTQGDEAIISRIEETALLALREAGASLEQVKSVGIGTPGIANCDTGIVEYSCNLGFDNTPLGPELSRRLGKEVLIENDANVAALGELYAGAGKGVSSLVAITLGTGIGGGVVVNRRLVQGFNFAGAELGHTVIIQGGELCNCGRRGCWEAYASATALIRQTKAAMEQNPDSLMWSEVDGDLNRVDGRTAFSAMERGDQAAAAVVGQYAQYLATGLVNMVNIFQPEVICIGGGISNAGETLLAPVREVLNREDYAHNSTRRCKLVRAQLGNDAGVIGAAMLSEFR